MHLKSLTKILFTYSLTIIGMFGVSLGIADAATSNCEDVRKALANIQTSIKKNELSLADKIKHKSAPQQQLNQLIKSHLASIEVYNKKTEEFNQSCANTPNIQNKPHHQASKATVKHPKVVTQSNKVIQSSPPTTIDINDITPKADILAIKGYFLQVGAFKQKQLAKDTLHQLIQLGWKSKIITKAHVYALWVGDFQTTSDVQSAKENLKRQGFDSYIIHIE